MKLPRRLERAEAMLGGADAGDLGAVRRLDLHTAQAQIVGEARRRKVLRCGRRLGKTSLA